MSATLSFTSMRPVPPENTRTEPLMSGERDTSTQPLASADTANDTPIDVSAAFCRTGADTISLPGLLSSATGFSGAFAPGWASAATAVVAAAANAPMNPRLFIVMIVPRFFYLPVAYHIPAFSCKPKPPPGRVALLRDRMGGSRSCATARWGGASPPGEPPRLGGTPRPTKRPRGSAALPHGEPPSWRR